MLTAAARHYLPLVELAREACHVDVTQATHFHILNAQFAVRSSQSSRWRRRPTRSSPHPAPTARRSRASSATSRGREQSVLAAILENLSHQVLAHGGEGAEEILAGWLVTRVAVRDEPSGRLVLV